MRGVVRELVRVLRAGFAVVVVLGLLAGLPGCGGAKPAARTLTVFAAASLTGTFTVLGKAFEAERPGTSVRFNFGSSAALAQQVSQGAPADVFAAASPATMRTVTDAALTRGPATVFVRNQLRIAVPADNPVRVHTLADLADPETKVALCAPQVPCGAAAAKALAAAGLKVHPVTLERDVKATLTKVELGEVDAALVYTTDVLAAAGRVRGIAFPEASTAVNDYLIATLKEAPAPDLAGEFLALVRSERGRQVLVRAGFEAP